MTDCIEAERAKASEVSDQPHIGFGLCRVERTLLNEWSRSQPGKGILSA